VRAVATGPWINFFLTEQSLLPSCSGANREEEQQTKQLRCEAGERASDDPRRPEPPVPHELKIEFHPAVFTQESYLLYQSYTKKVHGKEEESPRGYSDFLCSSPLFADQEETDGLKPFCGYGSLHQYYRLDGKLIAVGVLDVLRSCLTSVYFFYDPEYAFLSLGVYSALKEIELVQQINRDIPSFKYYYMAYYIYTCPNMNYKAKFRPSSLMCPFYREWVPLDKCIPWLRASGGRLTPFVERDEPPPEPEHLPIDRVPVLYDGCIVGFNQIRGSLRALIEPLVRQWCQRVSPDLASRIVVHWRD